MQEENTISPYSLVFVAVLMVSSQFWQPWVNRLFMEQSTHEAQAGRDPEGRLWIGKRDLEALHFDQLAQDHFAQAEMARLSQENAMLRKVMSKMKVFVKGAGEDLRFLAAQVMGRSWRGVGSVAVLNVGEDYNVKRGDWLLHLGAVCGQVVAVAGHTSLAVDMSSVDVRALVRVEGLKGEVIWEGTGSGRGVVRVRRGGLDNVVGRKIFLDEPLSGEGAYLVGEVVEVKPDQRGGWLRLSVEARIIPDSDILFVMQRHESSSAEIFAQRDRLYDLKREVRALERNKLSSELLQP